MIRDITGIKTNQPTSFLKGLDPFEALRKACKPREHDLRKVEFPETVLENVRQLILFTTSGKERDDKSQSKLTSDIRTEIEAYAIETIEKVPRAKQITRTPAVEQMVDLLCEIEVRIFFFEKMKNNYSRLCYTLGYSRRRSLCGTG